MEIVKVDKSNFPTLHKAFCRVHENMAASGFQYFAEEYWQEKVFDVPALFCDLVPHAEKSLQALSQVEFDLFVLATNFPAIPNAGLSIANMLLDMSVESWFGLLDQDNMASE